MTAHYHISLNAFLPTGKLMPDGKTREFVLHEGPTEIAYDGEPNCTWVPLNEEAVEAQRALLKKLIARQEETIATIDPKSRAVGMHQQKLASLKRQLAELKIGELGDKAAALEAELGTMADAQKHIPAAPGMQLKGNTGRPSDSPNRR